MGKYLIFVTGTRADFGKVEPLAIAAMEVGYRVGFFVTGMHMMESYGLTKIEVARVKGAEIVEFVNQNLGDPQDLILANTMLGFSRSVKEDPPDLVIVHGDRVEALGCALSCAMNSIRCAHIEGGEVSGTIDEIYRHCNTKLAHAHFVSSENAANRVRVMGEKSESIHVIGSPELDSHARTSRLSLDEVKAHYEIAFDDYAIVTFHPVTSEAADMGAQAQALFQALRNTGRNFVTILPNNDPGAVDILKVIEGLPNERFRVFPSLSFSRFSVLMKHAAAIIGNSSAGVREAPFLGVPSLNIGTRQKNRAQGQSITHAAADDTARIAQFFNEEWGKRYPKDAAFGNGAAAEKFIDILSQPDFWGREMQKYFDDHAG